MQMYPRWKYSDSAPNGVVVASVEAEAALGEGWSDNPDLNYVTPPPLGPTEGLPADAIARGFIVQPYPAHRYRSDGTIVVVYSQDQDDALDQAEFSKTPPPDEPARRQVIPFGSAQLDATPVAGSGGSDERTEKERRAADDMNAKARELHAMSVQYITDSLDGCTDPAVLRQVQTLEALNPEPRITLMKFISKALQALDAPQ